MTDFCSNYLDVPSHKPYAYLPEFGLLAQFDNPSMGDRPNCGSSESRGTRAFAPKSGEQTMTLN
jgi:hypothetical protein